MRSLATLGADVLDRLSRARFKRFDYVLALLVTLAGLVVFNFVSLNPLNAAFFSFIRSTELRSVDARFVLRGTRPHDPRIVIVGLDEKTLQKVGSYPIARTAYARMVDQLAKDGAAIIAFDFDFPTPEKNSALEALRQLEKSAQSPEELARIRDLEARSDNDAILAASIKRAGNVVLGHLFLDQQRARSQDPQAAEDYYNVVWAKAIPQVLPAVKDQKYDLVHAWMKAAPDGTVDGVEPNLKLLADAALSFGFFDARVDPDGVIRSAPLIRFYRERDFHGSLPLQVYREYEHVPDQDVALYIAPDGLDHIQFGAHTFKVEHDGSAVINYAGPYRSYPQYSMIDVIDGNFRPGSFKDKIVFAGSTALAIGDMRSTPYPAQADPYMGVEIHANVLDNLLHYGEPGRSFIHRGFMQEMVDLGFILFFGLVLGVLFSRLRPTYATLVMLAALAAFALVVEYSFSHWGVWLSFVVPAGTLFTNYASITTFRMITEEREKRKIRKSFESYVSPGVIRLIEKDPRKYFKPGGEMKDLTVMFSDIRSFTTIAEGLTPDELVFLLNEYLGAMTDILFEHWGTLDKYIGDALMAFWGSPFPQEDHPARACACALQMSRRLDEMNAEWERQGRKRINIGIGVNTGPVNVGNMGSSRRLAWTVMGDHVNLASRLEGKTKDYGVRILVSEFTYAQVQDIFVFRELDRITVKGKTKPVGIYQLLGFYEDTDKFVELVNLYASALDAYRRQDWPDAVAKFEETLTRFPDDGPSKAMLKRCREYQQHPPAPNWDGVYVMTTK
jgi:adenylate cyclase